MIWKSCTFEPLDVVGANDPRPLGTGGRTHSAALTAQVFAGALRTGILVQHGYDTRKGASEQATQDLKDLAARLGVPSSGGTAPTFRFAGPFIKAPHESLPLLPIPRHLLRFTDRGRKKMAESVLAPADKSILVDSGLDGVRPCISTDRNTEYDSRWLSLRDVCALLAQNEAEDDPCEEAEMFRWERRTGHGRAPSGTVMDRTLHTRSVLRFDRRKSSSWRADSFAYWGCVAGLAEVDLNTTQESVVRLGGDGHLARLKFINEDTTMNEPLSSLKSTVLERLNRGSGLLLYLATPAVFSCGWKPDFDPQASGITLVAAVVGHPLTIAGWDLTRGGRPKPVRRAVPAGSIYFCKVNDKGKAVDFVERYHFAESVSSVEDGLLGYGMALIGSWNGVNGECARGGSNS